MEITDKRFSAREINLLASLKRKKLESIDAVIVARDNFAWNTIRLHFADDHIDLNNYLGEIVVDEFGTIDEFGLLSINPASSERLNIAGVSANTSTFDVGQEIIGIQIINNIIDVFGNGEKVATVAYPQAVVLRLNHGVIVLDKENWFSEMIALKMADSIEGQIYDDSVNWEDNPEEDPSTHYSFKMETVTL